MSSSEEELRRLLDEVRLREKRSGKRALAVLLAPVLIGAALLAYLIVESARLTKENDRKRTWIAELQKQEAKLTEDSKKLEIKIAQLNEISRLLNEDQQALLATNESLREANKLLYSSVKDPDARSTPLPQEALTERIEQSVQSLPTGKVLPRVYIQIADERQRRRAQSIGDALREQLYIVPGIELVGDKAPRGPSQLRYFREDDGPLAEQIAGHLRLQRVEVELTFTPKPESRNRPKSGHFELWLARP